MTALGRLIRDTHIAIAKDWARLESDSESAPPIERLLANLLYRRSLSAEPPVAVHASFTVGEVLRVAEPVQDDFVQVRLRGCLESAAKLAPDFDVESYLTLLPAALEPNYYTTSADGDSSLIYLPPVRAPELARLRSTWFEASTKAPWPSAEAKHPDRVVIHPKFGRGTILRELGDRAEVAFSSGAPRVLLLKVLVPVDDSE